MTGSPMTISAIERVLILRRIPLFADLSPADLEGIARIAEERGYADGETIAREGELGDEMHVVTDGVIRVVTDLGGNEREIARRSAATSSARCPSSRGNRGSRRWSPTGWCGRCGSATATSKACCASAPTWRSG